MGDQLPRYNRAQRNAEHHQQALGDERRHRELAAGKCGDRSGHHRTRGQAARQLRPKKQQAAGGADGECLQRDQRLVSARKRDSDG